MARHRLPAEIQHAVAVLQRSLRQGARLGAARCGRDRGGLFLWMEWDEEPVQGAARVRRWCGCGRLGLGRRALQLALASALAELAMASGAGLAMWEGEGLSRPIRPTSPASDGCAGRSGSVPWSGPRR